MKPAETRYRTFDHELLAMYLAVKQFQHFVEGCKFHVLTDQKPLTFAFSTQSSKLTPHQTHHLDFISKFTTDVRHITGSNNLVADTLLLPNSKILNFNNCIDHHQHHLINYNQFHYQHQTLI